MSASAPQDDASSQRERLPLRVSFLLALGLITSLGILAFSEIGSRELQQVVESHTTALEVQSTLLEIQVLVTDAETAERGFVLLGKPEYLDPYRDARPKIEDRLHRLTSLIERQGTARQREQVGRINTLVGKKLGEIEATLALYERSGRDVAFELLNTGLGREVMDALRNDINAMVSEQRASMAASDLRWKHDIDFARFAVQWLTACTIGLLGIVLLLARREGRRQGERRRQVRTESERLEREVRERTADLAELSTHLQNVREEERSRLARDIHDELGAILVGAKMDISNVAQAIASVDKASVARLERALKTLDDGVAVKRRIIEELRPTLLDNLGLASAIEWQVHEVCDRAGLTSEINLDDTSDIPPGVGIALFRIVQEALTNVVKYAHARAVSIELLRGEDDVVLVVSDDGIGLPARVSRDRLSHGIAGMRQRVRALGGEFSIRGEDNRGTQIEVRVPLVRGVHPDGDPAGAEEPWGTGTVDAAAAPARPANEPRFGAAPRVAHAHAEGQSKDAVSAAEATPPGEEPADLSTPPASGVDAGENGRETREGLPDRKSHRR